MKLKHLDRIVGELRPDRVFISHRKEIHIFRKYNGLGMSFGVLMQLKRLNCKKIVLLLHKDNGEIKKYVTTPDKFIEHGRVYCDAFADYQRILSLDFLEQDKLSHYI